jgi:glyoxylase-like metal-dependent hydrolase (beta-lactamase superfamily II)
MDTPAAAPPSASLHHPLGHALPSPGSCLEVAPGVRWLRMRLPFTLDHINLWLLRDEIDTDHGPVQGWTVVDCGVHDAHTQSQWEQVFANELEGLPVLRVIVTHMHPDHIGLAHWLCERWSQPDRACRLWISAPDHHLARLNVSDTGPGNGDAGALFCASHGLRNTDTLAAIASRSYYSRWVPVVPPAFRRLMDGARLRIGGVDWQCISGYGHAPEHMALYCEALGLLISGDMVLPRITTVVGVFEGEPEGDPLGQFLDSLRKFAPLREDTLVLPAHGTPFVGLHTRLEQLRSHHRARLAETAHACSQAPCCAHDLLPVLFKRPLDDMQTHLAMAEALAHLHHLWHAGQLRRQRDAQGIYRFAA